MSNLSRREFAKVAAAGSLTAAALATASITPAVGQFPGRTPPPEEAPAALPDGSAMGLEIYTVRDQAAKDLEGTIRQVAAIGYKEVEPIDFGGLTPKQYRALMDKYGLTAISGHTECAPGPDLDKTLEGMQIMGLQYTWVTAPRRPRPAASATPPARSAVRRPPAAETPDSVKRTVDTYNQVGQVAKKYGIQVLVHNHAMEFEKFPRSEQCPYDIILAESDPATVVMQMDIGWASVAGQDPIAMFHKHPGRFVLWHVKDFMNLQYLFPQPEMTEQQRMSVAGHWMVPVGLGGIDYKAIFAHAKLAGMKHFAIEQDNAYTWGDSIAAARVCYHGLLRELAAPDTKTPSVS
ncbi:MAG TPA: sugar phosphate isomerase/epimerase [Terriglobales bacterium]